MKTNNNNNNNVVKANTNSSVMIAKYILSKHLCSILVIHNYRAIITEINQCSVSDSVVRIWNNMQF